MDAVSAQRERTNDQLAAIDILKRLDHDGAARQQIRAFVRDLPIGRARQLASALASWCQGKDNPQMAFIGSVRGGYARDVAEGVAEQRQEHTTGEVSWADIEDKYGNAKQVSDAEYRQRCAQQGNYLDRRRWQETHWGNTYSFVPAWTPEHAKAAYGGGEAPGIQDRDGAGVPGSASPAPSRLEGEATGQGKSGPQSDVLPLGGSLGPSVSILGES